MKKIKPKCTNVVITLEELRAYKQAVMYYNTDYNDYLNAHDPKEVDRLTRECIVDKIKIHEMEMKWVGGSIVTNGDYEYYAFTGHWPEDAV